MNRRTSTKQKLLNILKKDQKMTMKEIMVHFSISEIAVRRHVHELIQQGFIEKQSIKQEIGRPYHTYKLTKKGHATFPNEYETLPVEILQDLEAIQGPEIVKDVLAKRMEREKAEFQQMIVSVDFHEKVAAMVKIQEEKGFMIDYNQTINGDYEIVNYNCPIINIASKYQQVCANEQKVLSDVFPDSEVVSESCIATGGSYCKWLITKPSEEVEDCLQLT